MIIKEINIRGYKSFGNSEQNLKLNTEKGELVLLVGNNGNGKCVHPETEIEIDIDDLELNSQSISFLEETPLGGVILNHIEQNNPELFKKIKDFSQKIEELTILHI
jgi:energy-coupling factor transporter ATP-binding protein EcfA2